jgi:deoxyribodipyrimidine photo-lyase
VPAARVRSANARPVRGDGAFVLYWMTAARRPGWNPALQRALERAQELGKPLVVLEGLRAGYAHASDRLHRFALQGMRDNAAAFARAGVLHHPYVEPHPDAGKGLVETLSNHACLVVADEGPCGFQPRMLAAAAERSAVRVEVVDGCGLLPLSASERAWPSAHSFRRHLQRTLPEHLAWMPAADPLRGVELARIERLPAGVARRWPAAEGALLEGRPEALARLPIDHSVAPVDEQGGFRAARGALEAFLGRAAAYAEGRNHPEARAASGLSPWLHFGHLSAHEVFAALAEREGWAPDALGSERSGAREGWWGMSASAEAFLDQLVTWRELGLAACLHDEAYDRWEGLPEWARATLAAHEGDAREHVYSLEDLESAATHDELWNAAQVQLLTTGRLHNYLRMLWGKKVIEWSASPRDALPILIELNDRYALDGRDPNSYAGITWCFGRYDRPWAPERPIFGRVRWMSSRNTVRKLRMGDYLGRFGRERAPQAELFEG